ncbi:hypothetical protein CEP53_007326 [Fusarium sp. AF-6]|nr:hypothetical protein CEP53_007326 [Fusarium sp. AF-6]
MDPLSVSASIAGLVTLADLVFRATSRYAKQVKGAPKEVQDLLNEVKDLSCVLHNLSLVAFSLETDPDPQNANPPKPYHLHECRQLLRQLEEKLPVLETQSSRQKLQSRLKWPFSSSETKEILASVSRHKQTINIALAADSISKLNLCLSQQKATGESIKDLQHNVKKILDIETKISLDRKRREVLRAFNKVDARLELEKNRTLRHPMTGLWLTESSDFEDWYSTPKARIWCSGIPGAGKSVIAGAVVDECLQRTQTKSGTAVGYFFCTYRDTLTFTANNILSSLCSQLALQDETAYGILEAYHDELQSNQIRGLPTTPGLVQTLYTMCKIFTQAYLIVDGLDECGDEVESTVNDLVSLSLADANHNIHLFLLSRDEFIIRQQTMPQFHWIEIEAHTEDVQLYVATELEQRIRKKKLRLRDMALKDEILAKLVEGARGMFRWVTCQLDHLCDLPHDRARRKALNKLPPTLPAAYERILLKMDNDYDEETKQLVQRTLLLVFHGFPAERLSVRELCEAISISEDSDTLDDDAIVDEQDILRWCGSLLRTAREGQDIEFAHYTLYKLFDINKIPQFYAWAVELIRHCMFIGGKYGMRFGFQKRSDFGRNDDTGVKVISAVLRPDFTPLHLAAALGLTPVCQYLLENGAKPNLRSRFGTPLHCALGGLSVFADVDISNMGLHPGSHFELQSGMQPTARQKTTRLLLQAGSKTNMLLNTPFKSSTLLSLAVFSSRYGHDFEIIVDLINNGVAVEEEDLRSIAGYYQSARTRYGPEEFKKEYHDGQAFTKLLDALRTPERTSSPESRLYGLTLEFASAMKLNILEQAVEPYLEENTKDEHLRSFVYSAIVENNVTILEKLLSNGRSELVNSTGLDPANPSFTPLRIAIRESSLDALNMLLASGSDPNIPDEEGRPPMHLCWDDGDEDMLCALIRCGGSTISLDNDGNTIWHLSAMKNSVRILKVLVEQDERDSALPRLTKDTKFQANVVVDPSLTQLLSEAIIHEDLYMVGLLLEIVATDDGVVSGINALHLAAAWDRVECLELYLDRGLLTDLEARDDRQETPVHHAARFGHVSVLELLESHGADINSSSASDSFSTALHAALARPMFNALLPALVSKFVDEAGDFASARNPLVIAIESRNSEGLVALVNTLRIKGQLTILASLIHERLADDYGSTPLHLAAAFNDLDAAKVLLDNKADIDVLDEENVTPLHIAVAKRAGEVAGFLIARGARLNQRNLWFQTLLHIACMLKSWQMVPLLTQAEAIPNTVDYCGDNILRALTRDEGNSGEIPDVRILGKLLDRGLDPFQANDDGLSAAHDMLASKSAAYLRHILRRSPGIFQGRRFLWPHKRILHGVTSPRSRLLSISKNLRLVRHFVGHQDLLCLADLSKPGKHSLFCQAARWGIVEALRNFLDLGAKADHECHEHGEPLIAALANSEIDAARLLVRHGAGVDYDHLSDRAWFDMAELSSVAREWLLVSRYTEQLKLASGPWDEGCCVENWAGTVLAEVEVEWYWKQSRDESVLECAKRRQGLMDSLRGKIVKVRQLV